MKPQLEPMQVSRADAGLLGTIIVGEIAGSVVLLLGGTPDKVEPLLEKAAAIYEWSKPFGVRAEAIRQLQEYAEGRRTEFDFPMAQPGTEFQQRVWQVLSEIPFGKKRTYGDIARQLGMPKGARAVGRAIGSNRLFIVVPCHRVCSPKSLAGFAGGLAMKEKLLRLEGSLPRMHNTEL